jgi:hypothetical protein
MLHWTRMQDYIRSILRITIYCNHRSVRAMRYSAALTAWPSIHYDFCKALPEMQSPVNLKESVVQEAGEEEHTWIWVESQGGGGS